MSNAEPAAVSSWWRSWRALGALVLMAALVPLTVLLRADGRRHQESDRREFELTRERQEQGDALLQRYVDPETPLTEKQRVLRVIAANAHSDSIQVWANAEVPRVEAEVLKAQLEREHRDRLQMEAFRAAEKALAKDPAALAEHYRQLGSLIAEGRFGASGVIASLSEDAAPQPRLSDLMHKLIDEKQACLQSGKDEVACGDALGVVAEPTLEDFETMRALEGKRQDPEAQRKLADMRKRFLKEE